MTDHADRTEHGNCHTDRCRSTLCPCYRDAFDAADAENARLRAKVADLRRPPRGIGSQVVTVADCNPTYGHLLDSYHALEGEMLTSVGRLVRERDEALAEVAQLREALTAVVGHKHGNGYSEADAFDLARSVLAVSEEATDAEGGPRG